MIENLIKLAIYKAGNKRQLGIALGFPEKYAGQRVDKIESNTNFKMELLIKLMKIADVNDLVSEVIDEELKKIKKN